MFQKTHKHIAFRAPCLKMQKEILVAFVLYGLNFNYLYYRVF
jgi:hypothetical protein